MMHFDIDSYSHLKSPFHTFDPRAKVVCLLILIVSIVLINEINVLLLGFFSSVMFVLLCKIPISFILKRLRWVLFFTLALLTIIPTTSSGDVIFSFWFITVTIQGLFLAITISLKALSAALLVFTIVSTMPFIVFVKALEQLKIPNTLIQLLSFIYRYLFVISDEFHTTRMSIQSRSFNKKNFIYTIKILGSLIAMILIRSYERGERIRDAMISRGYRGKIKTLNSFKLQHMDILKIFLILFWAISLQILAFIKIIDMVV